MRFFGIIIQSKAIQFSIEEVFDDRFLVLECNKITELQPKLGMVSLIFYDYVHIF